MGYNLYMLHMVAYSGYFMADMETLMSWPKLRISNVILGVAPLIAMVSLSACASATRSAVPDVTSFIAIPGGDREMAEDEPKLIAGSKDRARRAGDDLILHFANGKSRTFHNDSSGCQDGPDHCDGYILIGDLPAFDWFVVFETAYEGGRFFLIDDRDGLPTEIPFWPTFSSDAQHLLIQNDDELGFFEGDMLEIWRREGYRMEREWIANPNESDTGVHTGGVLHTKLLSWTGDKIILEFRTDADFNAKTGERTPERRWTGTITHAADGWHLDARATGS